MSSNTAIFSIVFIFAVLLFLGSCYSRFRLVALGTPENRLSNFARRVWNMLLYAFAQRRVVTRSYPFGLNHFIFFWCFLVLFIANAEFVLHGLFPSNVALSRLPVGLHYALALIFDIVSLVVVMAVLVAVSRRLFYPPKYIDALSRDAFVILGLVTTLMLAFFGLHGTEISRGVEEAAAYMPVSSFVASAFLSGGAAEGLVSLGNVFWWIHALVFLSFLNYLPYSKHMHILAAIPNCFLRSLEKVTTHPREKFEKGNVFGGGQVDRLRWKDLFDTYACTECGRCTDVCPANATGKPLDPRLVVHNIKVNLLKNGPLLLSKKETELPLIDEREDIEGSVGEESIWDCTTCSACMEVCPVFIEHVPKIVALRRDLVEMRSKFPQELLVFFENMEQRSNPWGIAPTDREKWAAEIKVKPFEEGQTEYLFYVGCAGSFDARNRQVSLAVVKILDAAGVSWGILGKEEKCCGDSLRRLGNEFAFDKMARENIEIFRKKGVKKIITQCPHCFSTLKNDYRQYGIELEVIHHTEFINRLIKEGRLHLNGAGNLGKVVLHDSCYLGRYNDVYQPPRQAVTAATGQAPVEMERHMERSFCCGAGGGRMWMEESVGSRINLERVREALAKDPKTICVSCPYCMTMFEDGLKDEKAGDRVRVMDTAEIVAASLK